MLPQEFEKLLTSARYTQVDKMIFLSELSLLLKEYWGDDIHVTKDKIDGTNYQNLFIGDIKSAQTILTAHYDTPLKLWQHDYQPFNIQNHKKIRVKQDIIKIFIHTIIGVLFMFLAWGIYTQKMSMIIATVIGIGCCGGIVYYLYKALPIYQNSNNMNIKMLLTLLLENKECKNIAVVFTDGGYDCYQGDEIVNTVVRQLDYRPLIIHLDNTKDATGVFAKWVNKMAMSNLDNIIQQTTVFLNQVDSYDLLYDDVCICIASSEENNEQVKKLLRQIFL